MAWLGGALVLTWALAWLVVPPIVKSQLEKTASAQLGRVVSVGQIDFKPWTLELTIHDLSVAGPGGASAQFQLKRLYLNAELESLLRLAPVVDAVALDGPHLRLTHLGGGKYDIDDILARFAGPDQATTAEPLRFALFNLSLTGGSVDFDDRSVNGTHALRDLKLGVPFLSNLESRRAIVVEPRLAFTLNGSRFDSSALTTPFAASQKTDASISLRALDLAPYLPYLPSSLPVRLQQAVVGADIKLAFEQLPRPALRLSGAMQFDRVKLADAKAQELLVFDSLRLALDDVRPLERLVKIASIELLAPRLSVRRDGSGRINLDFAPDAPAQATAGVARVAAPASAAAVPPGAAGQWRLEVARFALLDGATSWSDAVVSPLAELLAREVSLEATAIAWPLEQPLEFRGSAALLGNTVAPASTGARTPAQTGPGASREPAAAARLAFSGSASERLANVKLSLEGVPLGLAKPYLAQFLQPALRGSLSSELSLSWKAPELQVAVQSLVLSDLALAGAAGAGKPELASIGRISISQAQIDLARRNVSVGKVQIDKPRLAVVRSPDKRWMFEDWLKPSAGPRETGKAAAAGAAARAPQAPWGVLVGELLLDAGSLSYDDRATLPPVSFELSALKLLLKNARPDARSPSPLQLAARIKTAQGEPGQLDYRGTLQMQPLKLQGKVLATQIPVHAFEPYFGAGLNIELLRADASFKGDVGYSESPNGAIVKVSGDAALEEFRANSVAANEAGQPMAEELLNWKALSLRGIDLALAPGTATTVAVKETTLGDFFARVIIHENGRINLQNLLKSPEVPTAAPPLGAASSPLGATNALASAPAAGAGKDAPADKAGALEPILNIGPLSLINGKVFFSDRFVKPNYSANLSELTGKLSAFSSVAIAGQPQLADLELRGRAEGTASLEIMGKLNPLAQPLALDVKGRVRDLELPPLSPYSVKYAGYGIQRGKLSVDVAYLVLPDGQLTASNKLVLNQLTFGDKVEGAPNSLPVKLAVALLADRNGVIDIDLPVSGSLNDPQFRLGPIIFKVIVNLIVKAITAPFSLLASAFGGGGDELGVVAFAPGSALLTAEARAGLDKVARALTERPALKMTVVGTSSLEAEGEAYKYERLQSLLQAEKRRALVSAGSAAATQEASAPISVSEAEMPLLLKEVYRRADIAKPRNLAGLAQDIPAPEMQALLLANIPVTEDAMRELALQRGIAAKDYLASRQLPVERLFLGATKPVVADAKWSPRAELSLATN